MTDAHAHDLSDDERDRYERLGYVVRAGVFAADEVAAMIEAIVYLDDSSVENGCTWVVPASHRSGVWRTRSDLDAFGRNELDSSAYPDIDPVPVEVEAGSTVSFGSLLVHQSTPNRSERDRRALLFSYQPAGGTTMVDGLRRLAGGRAG
ncbi:MAG TPA: phytanoyl-CoA dioxygenase family protein [Acidimicrobiales bacterium]|nr:phytanoyl-CoA dioxygenase family protein [Acidimicrobiales bacterium]